MVVITRLADGLGQEVGGTGGDDACQGDLDYLVRVVHGSQHTRCSDVVHRYTKNLQTSGSVQLRRVWVSGAPGAGKGSDERLLERLHPIRRLDDIVA